MKMTNKKLISNMIKQMIRSGYPPPYCLISPKVIDISDYPEITKMKINEDVSEDCVYLITLK